jgi:hypothetical protein
MAVGQSTGLPTFNIVTRAEMWDGSTWTVLSTPNPAGSLAASLQNVSCSSKNACIAVGTYFNATAALPLGERYSKIGQHEAASDHG